MKTTLLAAAVLTGIAGTSFGQAVTTALTSSSVAAAHVMNAGGTAQQTDRDVATKSPAPGGSGILVRPAQWTSTGMSAQLGSSSDTHSGQGASMQPGLGRGLAFGASAGRERP